MENNRATIINEAYNTTYMNKNTTRMEQRIIKAHNKTKQNMKQNRACTNQTNKHKQINQTMKKNELKQY